MELLLAYPLRPRVQASLFPLAAWASSSARTRPTTRREVTQARPAPGDVIGIARDCSEGGLRLVPDHTHETLAPGDAIRILEALRVESVDHAQDTAALR